MSIHTDNHRSRRWNAGGLTPLCDLRPNNGMQGDRLCRTVPTHRAPSLLHFEQVSSLQLVLTHRAPSLLHSEQVRLRPHLRLAVQFEQTGRFVSSERAAFQADAYCRESSCIAVRGSGGNSRQNSSRRTILMQQLTAPSVMRHDPRCCLPSWLQLVPAEQSPIAACGVRTNAAMQLLLVEHAPKHRLGKT